MPAMSRLRFVVVSNVAPFFAVFDKLWPVDLVDESTDQIRGWFYALLFMGHATFGKTPFQDVYGKKFLKGLCLMYMMATKNRY